MSRALVIGGSPTPVSTKKLHELSELVDFIVVVDKGMDICLNACITPDLFCGDGDSLSSSSLNFLNENDSIEKVNYDPFKDDTDLSLALQEVNTRGYQNIIVTSLLGGRLDHQLAVIGVLRSFTHTNLWWVEDEMIARFLSADSNSRITFNSYCRGKTISCIALEEGTEVSEFGTRWEVNHLEMDALSDRGVSNVIEADSSGIVVHKGSALICINEAPFSLLLN